MERIEHRACFGGWQDVYRHRSSTLDSDMRVAVYLPPQAEKQPVPALYWLSGLTCTEQNFIAKAGAQRYAAECGLA
ncbi:MAG TPA: alpha/beta hydrolase-fold protein, partial [Dyella sp.]|nr:alpha/beta hydrolase-fold protein [Dyella sp.]